MTKLEKVLFSLLIFLVPSNLAYNLPLEALAKWGNFQFSNTVNGIIVDYLIPKLFLTDILIISLLLLWLINHKSLINHVKKVRRSSQKKGLNLWYLGISFFIITLLKIPYATNPISALWFWLKLVELSLFFCWLRSRIRSSYFLLHTSLLLSVLYQSLLAFSQWLTQSSIFPYLVLGESQFSSTTPGIAKASFFGYLRVLPLGTTPHPNVLAGFIAISLVIIHILPSTRVKLSKFSTISKYIITTFGLFTLLLTRSLSALAALIFVGLFSILISSKPSSSTPQKRPLVKLLIISGLLLFTLASFKNLHILESTSLSRRATLNSIALKMIKNHPFGVGLNNFTVEMSQYGQVQSTTRFLQPVHNIYLLFLTETGLIPFVIVIFILGKITITPLIFRGRKRLNKQSVDHRKNLWGLPLLMILLIGLADHYLLTLQTGQLLFTLSIALALHPTTSPPSKSQPTQSQKK